MIIINISILFHQDFMQDEIDYYLHGCRLCLSLFLL